MAADVIDVLPLSRNPVQTTFTAGQWSTQIDMSFPIFKEQTTYDSAKERAVQNVELRPLRSECSRMNSIAIIDVVTDLGQDYVNVSPDEEESSINVPVMDSSSSHSEAIGLIADSGACGTHERITCGDHLWRLWDELWERCWQVWNYIRLRLVRLLFRIHRGFGRIRYIRISQDL